ncbi:MAG: lysozyme inhibitor LprI family protein [Pikeienuella sp.]
MKPSSILARLTTLCFAVAIATVAKADLQQQTDDVYAADYSALDTCLSAARSEQTAESCVGITYQPCLARSAEGSRVGEARCLNRELQVLEILLQEQTLLLLEWGHAAARDAVGIGSITGSEYFANILEAENLWRKNRAAQCNMNMLRWGAGTIVTTDRPICLARATARRIYSLRQEHWFR